MGEVADPEGCAGMCDRPHGGDLDKRRGRRRRRGLQWGFDFESGLVVAEHCGLGLVVALDEQGEAWEKRQYKCRGGGPVMCCRAQKYTGRMSEQRLEL